MHTRKTIVSSVSASLLVLAAAAGSYAQCGAIKLTSQTPTAGEQIGDALAYGVSASGQRLIVGAPKAEVGPYFSAGKVKIMARIGNQWGELAELTKPTTPFNSDFYGSSVGYNGTQIIVGAPGHLTNSGIAYIYEFQGTWNVVATINSSQTTQQVGAAVALDGNWAFIGAPGTDTANNADSGLVSIQKRNANGTWSQTQTVSDAPVGGFYINRALGAAVAAKGGVAVLAAPEGTLIGSPNFHGFVKIMRFDGSNTWNIQANDFAPAPRRIGANFGAAVATDGVRVVVGAPGYSYTTGEDGISATEGGSVWVMKFDAGAWTLEQQIEAPMPTGLGRFGSTVAIEGSRLLVGEPGTKTAYAYRLVGSTWALDRAYQDEDSKPNGTFGSSVAISDQNVFVADSGDDAGATTDSGAVYIKTLPVGYADSCEGAIDVQTGTTGGCTQEATPDAVPQCAGNSNTTSGKGVWMAWTPACSGNVIIDTFGSDFDTVLSVHTACPSQANPAQVTCGDDTGTGNLYSTVTFNYTAGTRYLINVRGFSTAAGNFVLRINEWQTPTNDSCSTPTSVSAGGTYPITNCKATTDGPVTSNACGSNMVNDLWYRYVAPAGGTLTLDTCGSAYDTMIQVFSGSVCPTAASTTLACADDTLACANNRNSQASVSVAAGQSYMIRVGGYATTAPIGDGALHVAFTPACPADWNHSGTLTVQDIFDFLNAWFAGAADFNNDTQLTVQDIFDFLNAWFAGCP